MTILIIYGGVSVEHEVSVKSARNISTILRGLGYGLTEIFITKEGIFTHNGKEVSILPARGFFVEGRRLDYDVILPLVHGNTGEDGKLQGLLELLGTPYISEGVPASSAGMDKLRQTEMVKSSVPCLRTERYISPDIWLGSDCVMKPCSGGSSVGVHIIKNATQALLDEAAEEIRKYDDVPIIQTLVEDARELELLALHDSESGECLILGPVEIGKGASFLSYDDKYASSLTRVIPACEVKIREETKALLREYSARVFRTLGGEIYMRTDFLMDRDGNVFFNEVNTIPGMTETSHFITLSEEIGFERLFAILIRSAFSRKRKNDLLLRSYE